MRPDGIKVNGSDPIYMLIPQFLTKRYDAMNMITVDIPMEPMRKFVNAKRKEGKAISYLGLIVAAYLRTAAEYPELNRFIGNKTVYQHKDFTVSMVVLKPGGGDTISKVYLDFNDDVFAVQKKMDEYIALNRQDEDQSFDKTVKFLLKLPLVMGLVIAILRFMDKHGLLPNSLVKLSPFHASFLISNLASIRTNHIYHHVYQFGSTSLALTMGNVREVPKRLPSGEVIHEKCMPLGIVMDERICSGHYFANAFARLRQYLQNPELLESPPKFKIYSAKEAANM